MSSACEVVALSQTMYIVTCTITSVQQAYNCLNLAVFSKRERITLRLLIAVAIPSVVFLSSVCCLWRWCTLLRRLNFSAILLHHTIAQGLYFSDAKNCWWGRPFPREICVQSDPPPFQTAQFRPISVCCAHHRWAVQKRLNWLRRLLAGWLV